VPRRTKKGVRNRETGEVQIVLYFQAVHCSRKWEELLEANVVSRTARHGNEGRTTLQPVCEKQNGVLGREAGRDNRKETWRKGGKKNRTILYAFQSWEDGCVLMALVPVGKGQKTSTRTASSVEKAEDPMHEEGCSERERKNTEMRGGEGNNMKGKVQCGARDWCLAGGARLRGENPQRRKKREKRGTNAGTANRLGGFHGRNLGFEISGCPPTLL